MAPRLQWSVELVSGEFIVPRLEDHLIDELFYQEDEIGEMRHTAFMVECGLEEDPPEGPDVQPVPWGDMLLKQQQQAKEKKTTTVDENVSNRKYNHDDNDSDNDSDSDDGNISNRREKRELPNRSRSTDDIDTLAIELTYSHRVVKKRPPMRRNSTPAELSVVDNGQSSPSSYIQFSPSSPGGVNIKPAQNQHRRPARRVSTKTSPETPPKRKAPVRGGLTKTRSGTTHEMASAAARARKKMNNQKVSDKDNKQPSYRKLTKTNSGTCHEMANAAAKAKKKLNAEKAKKKAAESVVPISSPNVAGRRKSIGSTTNKNLEKKGRPAPLIRSLVATKSGTKHGTTKPSRSDEELGGSDDEDGAFPKIVYKNGKRTAARRLSSVSRESRLKSRSNASSLASDSEHDKKKEKIVYRNGKRESIKQYSSFSDSSVDDDHFLGDFVRNSDDDSDARSEISISTHGSELDEVVISPPKEQKARFYGSPSAIKSGNRKRFSLPKSALPFSPRSPSPSIIEIARKQQGRTSRPNDFLCTDPLAAIKKKKERATTSSPAKPTRTQKRPDDWLGSGTKAKRTWRVKTKPTESPP